eukprot:12072296-Prorocentrum_lima.AAC.1
MIPDPLSELLADVFGVSALRNLQHVIHRLVQDLSRRQCAKLFLQCLRCGRGRRGAPNPSRCCNARLFCQDAVPFPLGL